MESFSKEFSQAAGFSNFQLFPNQGLTKTASCGLSWRGGHWRSGDGGVATRVADFTGT